MARLKNKKGSNYTFITAFITVIFVLAVILFIIGHQQNTQIQSTHSESTVPVVAPNAVANTTENTEVFSPDGSMKLTMKMEKKEDGSKEYSFFVSDKAGNNP